MYRKCMTPINQDSQTNIIEVYVIIEAVIYNMYQITIQAYYNYQKLFHPKTFMLLNSC